MKTKDTKEVDEDALCPLCNTPLVVDRRADTLWAARCPGKVAWGIGCFMEFGETAADAIAAVDARYDRLLSKL